ncbi:MAG: HD-GYP domain-containing protein [Methylococcaceae bacterium]|nr:MAG: HD-GYP domain-containing protein [Methylococcaceae bacterium]
MHVCRIERGWVDTCFWSNGSRVIASAEEVRRLRECCQHVYIDTAKGCAPRENSRQPQSTKHRSATPGVVSKNTIALYQHSHSVLEAVFADARLGGSIDDKAARAIVHDLILSVLADSNALLCLTWLKDKNDSLARKAVNVCILALVFGKAIGIPKAKLHDLGLGALLHDVGMLKIPNALLYKPAPLSTDERNVLERHVLDGSRMLAASRTFSDDVLKIIHAHHEWLDGSGYPQKLKGHAIGLFPRMVSIVSVYEALTRERGYGKPLSPASALRHLYRSRGAQFDARLVDKFISTLGIYPTGCLVKLSNGAIGQIIAVTEQNRLRPSVRIIMDADGRPIKDALIINLADESGLFVKQAMEPEQLPEGLCRADPETQSL